MKSFFLIFPLFVFSALQAQNNANPASVRGFQLRITPGFSPSVRSETNMTYTVAFVIPVTHLSAPNMFRLRFNYAADAALVGVTSSNPYAATGGGGSGGYNLAFTPSAGQVAVMLTTPQNLLPPPHVINGSFQVTIKVPSSVACQGKQLVSFGIIEELTTDWMPVLRTSDVVTTVTVDNPWIVRKYATNVVRRANTNTCLDLQTEQQMVNYRVEIFLQRGSDITGSQDLNITAMNDVVTGINNAVFGNVQLPVNLPAGFGVMANGAFNTAGLILQARSQQSPVYGFDFEMTMPNNVPNNTCINNRINMTGQNACLQNVTLNPIPSNITKMDAVPLELEISKSSFFNGNTPGCTGIYIIRVRNNTNQVRNGYTFWDIFPACFNNNDINNAGATILSPGNNNFVNCNNCVTRTVGAVNPLTYTIRSATNLAPGEEEIIHIPITISAGCQNCITNMIFDNPNPQPANVANSIAHTTNCLLALNTVPCVKKFTCPNSGTRIGQTIRFRLQIQNYGQQPMTNWSLTDDLNSVGLQYAGGARYFFTDQRSLVPPLTRPGSTCFAPGTALPRPEIIEWDGRTGQTPPPVATPNGPLNRNVRFDFSTFNIACDPTTAFEGNLNGCEGAAGQNLPAFFIEFDAIITSDAGIGESMNVAVLRDGNGAVVNTGQPIQAPFTVNDNVNLTLKKEVSTDGGATYSDGTNGVINVQPGQSVRYKLTVFNTGLSLINPYLIDLLPQNTGGGVNDRYLLQTGDRGSSCNVFYDGFVTAGSTAGSNTIYENGINLNLSGNPNLGSTAVGGANLPAWNSNFIANQTKNFKSTYLSLPSSSILTYIFKGKIDPEATLDQIACNTFAVRGSKKTMQNYQQIPSGELQLPAESPQVCIRVGNSQCCTPDSFNIPDHICFNNATTFCVVDNCACLPTGEQNVYVWDFHDQSQPDTGKCVTHTFSGAGNPGGYDVTVTWTECGVMKSQTFNIHADYCNSCDITPDFSATTTGMRVDVNAATTISQQPIKLYVWDFGDGSFGSGVTAYHVYTTPGYYMIYLTVYALDQNGNVCDCKAETRKQVYVPDGIANRIYASSKTNVPSPAKTKGFSSNKDKQLTNANARGASSLLSLPAPSNGGGGEQGEVFLTAVPNPFTHSLNVTLSAANSKSNANKTRYELSVIDATGKVINTQVIIGANKSLQLDTKAYASGTYLITVKGTDGTTQTKRVVKINQYLLF